MCAINGHRAAHHNDILSIVIGVARADGRVCRKQNRLCRNDNREAQSGNEREVSAPHNSPFCFSEQS
jgi:hypothetical protein